MHTVITMVLLHANMGTEATVQDIFLATSFFVSQDFNNQQLHRISKNLGSY
jgi:hypothetical protein